MSRCKRFIAFLSLFCLFLFPVTAYACFDGQKTGTTQVRRIVIPVSLQQGSGYTTGQTWVQVPGSDRRISISYRLQLRPYTLQPSQPSPTTPPAEPPADDPPVTTPPADDPPATPAPTPPPADDPPATTPPAPAPTPPPAPEPAPPVQNDVLTVQEQQMLDLVNMERRNHGLSELEVHPGLVKLARLKSQDMITNNYFSHQSPTYGSPFDMIRSAGISYRFAGENLAGAPTVERAHTNLMNSPGHRANILNRNFTHIGIGIIDGGRFGKMFTQMFIGVN